MPPSLSADSLSDGDVVCVAIVPRGQAIDWSPGSYEPDRATWVPEGAFLKLLEEGQRLRLPILKALDMYAQTRISPAECQRMLSRWKELEVSMAETPEAAWVAAVGKVLQACADSVEPVEMLIEGP